MKLGANNIISVYLRDFLRKLDEEPGEDKPAMDWFREIAHDNLFNDHQLSQKRQEETSKPSDTSIATSL
jgi:hypothetical protein